MGSRQFWALLCLLWCLDVYSIVAQAGTPVVGLQFLQRQVHRAGEPVIARATPVAGHNVVSTDTVLGSGRSRDVVMKEPRVVLGTGSTAFQILEDAGLLDVDQTNEDGVSSAVEDQRDGSANHVAAQERLKDAELSVENAQLRQENSELHQEENQLRQEGSRMRVEDAHLRFDDDKLLEEDSKLRNELATASGLATLTQRNVAAILGEDTSARKLKSASIFLSAVAMALVLLPLCSCCCFESAEDDVDYGRTNSSKKGLGKAEESQNLRELLDGKPADTRSCFAWCYRRRAILYFFLVVVVVSISAGCILWQMGLLQPILAQFAMYLYVIIFVSGFFALLTMQVWGKLRRMALYLQGQFGVIDRCTHPTKFFQEEGKYKWFNMVDDGKLNPSALAAKTSPGALGALGRGARDFLQDGGIHQHASAAQKPLQRNKDRLLFPTPRRR